jgi:hypothetical protein
VPPPPPAEPPVCHIMAEAPHAAGDAANEDHGNDAHGNAAEAMEQDEGAVPQAAGEQRLAYGEWSNTAVGEIYELKLNDRLGKPMKTAKGQLLVFKMRRGNDGKLTSEEPDWLDADGKVFDVKPGGDSLHHVMLAATGPHALAARTRVYEGKRYVAPTSMMSFFKPKPKGSSSTVVPPTAALAASASAAPTSASPAAASSTSASPAAASSAAAAASSAAAAVSSTAATAASSSASPASEEITGGPTAAPRKRSIDPVPGQRLCEGYVLPGLLHPVAKNYPHHLHATAVNWSHPDAEGRVFSTAPKCTVMLQVDDVNVDASGSMGAVCSSCQKLAATDNLKAIIQRASNERLHATRIKSIYLTYTQLCRRSEMHKKNADLMRVKLYHSSDRVKRLDAKLDLHKQLLTKLTEHDVIGLRKLLVRWHQGGASVKVILRQVQLCIDGRYKPRNAPTDLELDKAQHALILGGPRMLFGLQKTCGFLAQSTVHTHRPSQRFITSWDGTMYAA